MTKRFSCLSVFILVTFLVIPAFADEKKAALRSLNWERWW